MDTKKMRERASLLPHPGDLRVCECLDEIERLEAEVESLKWDRGIEAGLAERFRAVLYIIADGDASAWPGCSSRQVAALALGRDANDINRRPEDGPQAAKEN